MSKDLHLHLGDALSAELERIAHNEATTPSEVVREMVKLGVLAKRVAEKGKDLIIHPNGRVSFGEASHGS